jgi:hypothetical protein
MFNRMTSAARLSAAPAGYGLVAHSQRSYTVSDLMRGMPSTTSVVQPTLVLLQA